MSEMKIFVTNKETDRQKERQTVCETDKQKETQIEILVDR
jgi:hypothetical protein